MAKPDKPEPPLVESIGDLFLQAQIEGRKIEESLGSLIGMRIRMNIKSKEESNHGSKT